VLTIELSANKDKAAFADPERFDITRTGQPGHVGFGHGPHFCLGASLARLELTTAIAALVTRFPGLRLAVSESDLEWLPNRIVFTTRELLVAW
jgi:cytochrome P450